MHYLYYVDYHLAIMQHGTAEQNGKHMTASWKAGSVKV
jgi:hypothetical protein